MMKRRQRDHDNWDEGDNRDGDCEYAEQPYIEQSNGFALHGRTAFSGEQHSHRSPLHLISLSHSDVGLVRKCEYI